MLSHARLGNVDWKYAATFCGVGVAGTLLGTAAGKAVDGQRLLALFGLLMIGVAIVMLRGPNQAGRQGSSPSDGKGRTGSARLAVAGLLVGLLSGFFGIGGGFLVVPSLVFATGMPLINAVGTSLVAVAAFGTATAASYAASGLVDWHLTAMMLIGGGGGVWLSVRLATALAGHKQLLGRTFGGLVAVVGTVLVVKGLQAWFA